MSEIAIVHSDTGITMMAHLVVGTAPLTFGRCESDDASLDALDGKY